MEDKTERAGRGRGWRNGKIKYTAAELEEKCRAYLSECDSKEPKHKPTWQGFAVYLGVSSDTLTNWMNDKKGCNSDVSHVLKLFADETSDRLQQRTDAMSIFALKQPCYGGFMDRPVDHGDGQINVNVRFGNMSDKEAENFGK